MIELREARILEEIAPPGMIEEAVLREHAPVHRRPGVVDQPGMQSRDQRAEQHLHIDERDNDKCNPPPNARFKALAFFVRDGRGR